MNHHLICAMFLVTLLPAACGASEMDRVVHNLEADLGVHRTHIPMLGAAMFVGKVATGFQMPGVKLAIFEDERLGELSPQEIEQSLLKALGPQWTAFVKSTSKYGEEQNWIYVCEDGKKLQMFIANVESNELALIQLKVSEKQMRRWINDTDEMAKKH
jgi:hypothetical protein